MRRLGRRQFTRLVVGGTLLSLANACGLGEELQPTGTVPNGGTPSLPSSPVETVSPTPARAILRNDNVPGFFVRYYKPFQAVDPDQWTLTVDGLVRNPQSLSLSDVLALPRVSQVSRMKCVECWSAAAKWEGFHLSSLLEIANPYPDAKWVHFRCADGYYESMSIEGLLKERVIFVHHMNDQILPDVYGAPLRLMVPFLYGYKSAKALVHLEFAEDDLPGYWPTVGPYTEQGAIRAGFDHPLDLEGSREIAGGSEIVYPDGIESQEQKDN
jgi:sulfoxide reductase catalytic subunit YedY